MRSFLTRMLVAFALAFGITPSFAAGTIPVALTQQQDVNGRPLAGCLLYIYQVGTTATMQNAFSDFGLTLTMPNPMTCDQTGRIPMFYLADGQVHVRLTDAGGLVQFDIPVMQVVGPSTGGGGGGGGADPAAIASTGDLKFRPTVEILTGWVKLNGLTIGNATSGATQRANNDTQALFIYLWNNCDDTHCPVIGGRGASGLLDFNANKQITLPDLRGRSIAGLDDMGNASRANRILDSNVASTPDTALTPLATGGEANHTLVIAEMPAHGHVYSGSTGTESASHTHGVSGTTSTESAAHAHNVSVSSVTGLENQAHAHTGTTGTENAAHQHTVNDSTGLESSSHGHAYVETANNNQGGILSGGGLSANSGVFSASTGGEDTAHSHFLSTVSSFETVNHDHSFSTNTENQNHNHNYSFSVSSGFEDTNHSHTFTTTSATESATHTHAYAGTTASTGGGTSHGTMNPFMLGTWYMKL